MLLFRYWVEFDESGNIIGLYDSKPPNRDCREYLLKLIPIDRTDKVDSIEKRTDELGKELDKFISGMHKVNKELQYLAKLTKFR